MTKVQVPPPLPPLPPLPEWVLPPHWGTVDLVSDLHLCEALPRTFAAFAAFLHDTAADAVVILGDLFEVWVGDDMAQHGFEHTCATLLAQAASRRPLAFMLGNRDFLAGPELARRIGWQVLSDPTVLVAWGQRLLLSHGDALCLSDLPYQAFRTEVRSAPWQATFLARPLPERQAIAAQIRQASKSRRQFDGAMDADLDASETRRWLQAGRCQTLIHGHTHRPADHALGGGLTRQVLSDWDLDHGQRAQVLRLRASGTERLSLQQAARNP